MEHGVLPGPARRQVKDKWNRVKIINNVPLNLPTFQLPHPRLPTQDKPRSIYGCLHAWKTRRHSILRPRLDRHIGALPDESQDTSTYYVHRT